MFDVEENEILYGGRSTKGVVKVGDTVRRPHKRESDYANQVLVFLEEMKFLPAPCYLGQDKQKRHVYTYIDGYVPDEIGFTTNKQLIQFVKIVRQFHDLSVLFPKNTKEVLCHNDLSPCNTVFQNDIPIGIIDWDSVSEGERWEDLTYIFWLWINIGSHNRVTKTILEQINGALKAYGADDNTRMDFSDKLLWRMNKVINDMPPENYQYMRTCEWVEFSKLWVNKSKNEINASARG